MKYAINRYTLTKGFVSSGTLTVEEEVEGNGIGTRLIFEDSLIKESSFELYHPLTALDSLRRILEQKHQSLINCSGCRVDVSHRGSGGRMAYLLVKGKQATQTINMFEPTEEIIKLCTVDEHLLAYKEWCDSLGKK